MKVIANIIRFIVITILTVCMISIGIITVVSSTILDQSYVMQKLEENNFYSEMYELVKSNFENYIYQSGLDEEILNDICTQDKVKKDINIMLSNIYQGTNEKIDTTEIANNLNAKIDQLGIKNSKNEKAINDFVKHICNEYTDTLVHTNYEDNINEIYNKTTKVLDKLYNTIVIILIVSIIVLIIINIKQIRKIIQGIGMAFLATSTFDLIACNIVESKVDIQGIKILNDTFSKTIVSIIQEIVDNIKTMGVGALVVAIVVIIIYSIIEANKNAENRTEEKTTDK